MLCLSLHWLRIWIEIINLFGHDASGEPFIIHLHLAVDQTPMLGAQWSQFLKFSPKDGERYLASCDELQLRVR